VGGTVSWNDTGLPAQYPHNTGDGRAVRVSRTALGYDSQAVSEGRRGEYSPLTWAPVSYQSIKAPVGEVGAVSWVKAASIEAEIHSGVQTP
jgi:hypothetical protein